MNPTRVKFHELGRCLLLLLFSGLMLAGSAAVFGADEARIFGRVTDESGAPVAGVTVRLIPAPDAGVEQEVKTNKKGKFAFPMVQNGVYQPSIEDPGWVIKHVEFSGRGPGGQKAPGGIDEEIQPGRGVPAFSASPLLRGELNLTVTAGAKPQEDPSMLQKAKDESPVLVHLNELFAQQDWEELIVESDAVLADRPDLGGAHYLRAVALWRVSRYPEAIQSMRTARELVPNQPSIRGTLGTLLVEYGRDLTERGDEEAAAEAYAEALGLLDAQLQESPEGTIYRVNRVVALDGLGRTDELRPALEELIEINPQLVQAYFRLAELLMDGGDPEAAIAVLERLPTKGTEGATMLYNAAVELWNQGAKEATLMALDKAIEMDPTVAELYRLKGRAQISTGRDAEGVETLEKYLGMVPEDDPGAAADRALVEAIKKGQGN